MPLLRFIFTSLAVLAGLIGALALMMIGFVVFVLLRLFGRPATRPQFRRPSRPNPARPAYSARDDVIDVVTTEVKE
jgi:hypothetical protein